MSMTSFPCLYSFPVSACRQGELFREREWGRGRVLRRRWRDSYDKMKKSPDPCSEAKVHLVCLWPRQVLPWALGELQKDRLGLNMHSWYSAWTDSFQAQRKLEKKFPKKIPHCTEGVVRNLSKIQVWSSHTASVHIPGYEADSCLEVRSCAFPSACSGTRYVKFLTIWVGFDKLSLNCCLHMILTSAPVTCSSSLGIFWCRLWF